jgi:short subunit dehydrogenase-like uncharacterized protein
MSAYLIYGANGYTGALVVREAVARGQRPILAGRSATPLASLAQELNLEHRVFSLADPAAIDAGLREVTAVLNCAGPFSRTAQPLADACLRTKTHYLDITGEIAVFESMAARDQEAQAAGVILMPGVGFDVVPSDCLAAHLKRRLPSASRLTLAFHLLSRPSRGTATTMVENFPNGGLVRKAGKIKPVPAAWKSRPIDFGSGPLPTITIPWGDVSTAYYSTAIPDIEVYMAAPAATRFAARLSRYTGWLLGMPSIQTFLKGRIQAGAPGPTAEERATGKSFLWGEVADADGRRAVSRLQGPEGYTLTVLTALAILERVVAGDASPGFKTPSLVYGPDFVLTIPGVIREDEAVPATQASPRPRD